VNYRANIYAAKTLGVTRIVAWTGPGAISRTLTPGRPRAPRRPPRLHPEPPGDLLRGEGDRLPPPAPGVLAKPCAEPSVARGVRAEGGKRHAGSLHFAAPTPARGAAPRDPCRDPVPRARRGGSRRMTAVPRGRSSPGSSRSATRRWRTSRTTRKGCGRCRTGPERCSKGCCRPARRRPSRRRKRDPGDRDRCGPAVEGRKGIAPAPYRWKDTGSGASSAPTSRAGWQGRKGRAFEVHR